MVDHIWYNGIEGLLRGGVKLPKTAEEVSEFIKCANDPIYFIDTYCKIVTLDHGLQPFKLFSPQKKMVKMFHDERRVLVKVGRQSGKCQTGDTLINVRNKKTGEVTTMTVEQFHRMISEKDSGND
jgi:hypothetical protein